jgi:hypothetical protein
MLSYGCVSLQHAQVVSNKTGTIPLKLPKPLLLSQFSGISLPHSLPLDLVVDGTPAGVCWIFNDQR